MQAIKKSLRPIGLTKGAKKLKENSKKAAAEKKKKPKINFLK